ncbi:hypothetical protein [Georgenia sp. H159]|uniref:hypothetical protein n=1 Tax=Georgenia sp. H159 TaxID=3076115 RepID=UPI002D79EF6C|nr:hypothetical protein [Georgenia sp. H159]
MQPSRPAPLARQFIVIAAVSGVAMVAVVLLWVAEVVSLGVMVAVIAAVGAAELGAVMLLQRRAQQQRARTDRLGGTSTIGPDSPAARYGYDPMSDQNAGR